MEEKEKQASVSYFVHEGVVSRMERMFHVTVAALVLALVVCVVSFVFNDMAWRKYCDTLETRYETVVEGLQDAGVYEQPDAGTD